LGAPVVTGCDAAPVLQSTEHDLDPVATPIPSFVVADCLSARLPTGYAGAYPLVFQRVTEPVGVMAPVSYHLFGSVQTAKQCCRPGVVADLACGHKELQRTPLRIGYVMQFGVQPALRAPDQAPR
jgi:hypothetical protein